MFISRDDINNNLGWITHNFLMDNITNESNKNNGRNLNLNKKIKSGKIDDNYYYNWNDDSNYEKTSNEKHNYIAKKYRSLQTYVKHFNVAENLSFSL